jgi:hypothetical protein
MSNFFTSIANDYQILDGQFTATYTQAGNTTSVAGVTRQKLSLKELEMLGGAIGMEPTLRAFSLPTPTLVGVIPQSGDTLTDDADVAWLVKSVDQTSFNSRWIVYAQRKQ